MSLPRIGITAAAEASGISAQTLRAWERRYGFPDPARTAGGERLYSAEQLAKLKLVRRLIQRGHRVSKVASLSVEELERLVEAAGSVDEQTVPLDFQECLRHLSGQSIGRLRRLLQAALIRQGLAPFSLGTVRPLTRLVGGWWAEGKIEVYQEHLFAEQLERLLREVMAPLEPAAGGPKILLTTLPDEQHRLGLLMVEALLRVEGADCIPLGSQMPPTEIVKLCRQSKADVVALSFSAAYRDGGGRRALSFLRRELADNTAIWAGGSGAPAIARGLPGIVLLSDLEDGVAACRDCRPQRLQ